MTLLGRWLRENGPPKWLLTWVSFSAGTTHLVCASLGVSHFAETLEAALYFYGSLVGIGTAGAVTLHATGRKYDFAAAAQASREGETFTDTGGM
jgi:hypothetical protein